MNGELFEGGEMPSKTESIRDYYKNFKESTDKWNDSLVKLECSEVELDKIKHNLIETTMPHIYNSIIDIISITTVKGNEVFFREGELNDADKLRLAVERMLAEVNASEETIKYWNDFTETFIKEKLSHD